MSSRQLNDKVEIEVIVLRDTGGWDSSSVWVPLQVASSKSQDMFLKWSKSPDAKEWRKTLNTDFVGAFVKSFEFTAPLRSKFVQAGTRVRVVCPAMSERGHAAPTISAWRHLSFNEEGVLMESTRIGKGVGLLSTCDILLDGGDEISVYAHQLEIIP